MVSIFKRVIKKILPAKIIYTIKHIQLHHFRNVRKHIKGKNNNILTSYGVTLINVTFNIIGSGNTIQLEDGVYLKDIIFDIRGNNNKCFIARNSKIQIGGKVISYGHNTCLKIMESTYIGQVTFVLLEDNSKIMVGKNCMFSVNIEIRTGDSHLIFNKSTNERVNFAKDVIINDHVWIGANCTILKGVIIQKDSIIGISSVVTKPFEESNIIIAGVPAKIIKRDIGWSDEHCPPYNIVTGDFEYEK